MNNKTIITNLRMPENQWLQIRIAAAELGISANQYVNLLLETASIKRELAEDKNFYGKLPIWDLAKIKVKTKDKGKGLSEDDQLIYG